MVRRWHAVGLAILAVFALACESAGGASDPGGGGGGGGSRSGLPSSIVALGDSITAAYGTCKTVLGCGQNSWSTGSSEAVASHYRRLAEDNPKIREHRHNVAVPGARAEGLRAQANRAVRDKAQYVTILIGANDVCRGTVDAMTEVKQFRAQVDAALDRLADGVPKAVVRIASIPDIHRLWQIGHTSDRAVQAWQDRSVCPALLANPRSTDQRDVRRRREVDRRVDAYNRELGAACRAYPHECWYDGGAVHRIRFGLDLVSERDYFHPNVAGQRELADATYPSKWR